jgi:hypothetical protein
MEAIMRKIAITLIAASPALPRGNAPAGTRLVF